MTSNAVEQSSSPSPRRVPRVAFMTTVGKNVGDEFIREGIASLLAEAIGPFEPYYVNKHDLSSLAMPLLDEMDLVPDKFAAADVLVQAGAPVFWHLGESRCYREDWVRALWHERIFPLAKDKPFLNLGAGSCQAREGDIEPLVGDPDCVDFVRRVGSCATLTTSRDPLTSDLLDRTGACAGASVPHELLPCPAFHAARRVNGGRSEAARDVLAVNLMELAGHYMLKPENDPKRWSDTILAMLPRLRERYRLLFVAHDEAEVKFLRYCNHPHERIFFSHDFRDYLSLYSRVAGIVANRVHAAVCVAGFGRPAVIVGNDSRIGIARPIGIPAADAADATAEWIVDSLNRQMDRRDELMTERMELRESSARRYVELIREALGQHPAGRAFVQAAPATPLPAEPVEVFAPRPSESRASHAVPALPSEVTLQFFDRPPRLMPVPGNDEIFAKLVYRAPPSVVPALYQRRYYEDYFLLARYFAPRSILEIGSRFGYSLVAMCRGAASPARVVSIDLQSYANCFELPTQVIARRNLDACIGPDAQRRFVVGDSHEVELPAGETFELIHVDGDHTETGARDDVLKYYDRLAPGGVMLVDDLDQPPVYAGFVAAVQRLGPPPQHVAVHAHKHGLGMLIRDA
jgi:SAM-dependent methyltransferase